MVLGMGKGVLFREVSSVQSVLIERERFHCLPVPINVDVCCVQTKLVMEGEGSEFAEP